MSKYRVHELAKKLSLNSKDIIETVNAEGGDLKSHMSMVPEAVSNKMLQDFAEKIKRSEEKKSSGSKGNKKAEHSESKKKSDDKKDEKQKKKDKVKNQSKAEAAKEKQEKTSKKVKMTREEAAIMEEIMELEEIEKGIVINVPITLRGFSEQTGKSPAEIIMVLMKLGIMATINQELDEAMVLAISEDLGLIVTIENIFEEEIEAGLEDFEDAEALLKPRAPVVTVMGHVDHGKTSLLDAIRKTSVIDKESGGITQHIGASTVHVGDKKIVFLDTPGHEAFTAMRARGAQITDIAILVVAADDSVKPQTIEAISHARAANIPIIVAVNKIDKPEANPNKVMQDLTEHGILVEEWGGDVISVPVSAKSGQGLDQLLEMVLLQAEIMELKANPDRYAIGRVIEARLDKSKGPVATVLIQKGTLKIGNPVVAGVSSGKVRAMHSTNGSAIKKAGPATAVEILGLSEVPEAGDEFNALKEEKTAKSVAKKRHDKQKDESIKKKSHVTLEDLFSEIEAGNIKDLNLVIKADVQGSLGAIEQSLTKLSNKDVQVKIVYSGIGAITESDVLLAAASNAVIIGFNVRPALNTEGIAGREGVEMKTYRVIYEAIDDVQAAMKGMLDPEFKEVVLGKAEVRNVFKVSNIGTIAGSYVIDGKITRNASIRLVRDGIVIHEGIASSLKRFKDDAREVLTGFECGIGIDKFNDIKEGDIIEAFHMEEIERK